MPDFSFEDSCGYDMVVGIDEVGRGPWAGPVVAASVFIPKEIRKSPFILELNDSKKLSKPTREKLFHIITHECLYGVGIVSPKKIDEINILQASFLAMEQSLEALTPSCAYALIDGNKIPEFKTFPHLQKQAIVKGDSHSNSIAAASIVAKVTRDKIMEDLHQQTPYYGWNTNSGYGTKAHQDGLEKHGITDHHRKSFAPIKKLLSN